MTTPGPAKKAASKTTAAKKPAPGAASAVSAGTGAPAAGRATKRSEKAGTKAAPRTGAVAGQPTAAEQPQPPVPVAPAAVPAAGGKARRATAGAAGRGAAAKSAAPSLAAEGAGTAAAATQAPQTSPADDVRPAETTGAAAPAVDTSASPAAAPVKRAAGKRAAAPAASTTGAKATAAPAKAPTKAPTKAPAQAPAKTAAAKAPARASATKAVASAKAGKGDGSPYSARPWLAQYPEGVPADYDFPKVPLTRLLDDAAASYPTNTALAFLGTKVTYRELKEQVDRFASALASLGVRKGDRVALVLPNCPQNVIAFFATLRLGAVVVEHNPLYTEAELRHQLSDCGAKVAIVLDKVYDAVAKVKGDTSLEHVVVTSVVDYLPASTRFKLKLPIAKAKKARAEITAELPKGAPVKQFTALLKQAGLPARQAPIDPETDLALLQYTGGTTGLSKGARLSHHNLVSNAYQNRLWDPSSQAGKEVCLAVLPLFHVYGLTVSMLNSILLGGTMVLLPRFDLDQVFEAIDEWKPTMFPGVPPIYKAMVDSPKAKQHDLRSIRVCISGAMKLPTEVQEQFEKVTGGTLVEGYGMTETSPSTLCNPLKGARKPGSIGIPLPATHAKLVDQDDSSKEVPLGQPGELAIKGPQVFSGYWGKEDQTGIFTADGYVLTGDIAVMDEDGFFSIVDRKKELIIAGGFNIYPSEVEDVLFSLEGVADAVVVGVPDKYRGETVKAYVVKQPGASLTEDDVIAHCAKSLTAYKVPKLVEFRDALPRTVVGKVLRRVLLEEEKAKLAQGDAKPASVPGSAPRAKAAAQAAAGAAEPAATATTAGKTPAKTTAKAPAKAPAKTAAKASATPAATPAAKAPAKKAAPVKAPATSTTAPEKAAAKAPAKAPAKKAPAKAPAKRSPKGE